MITRIFAGEKDLVGLHLTRSIGDTMAHKFGVTSEPEIKHYIVEEDE